MYCINVKIVFSCFPVFTENSYNPMQMDIFLLIASVNNKLMFCKFLP